MQAKDWKHYRVEDVVDVDGIEFGVRTYIEHRDLRAIMNLVHCRHPVRTAVEFGCGYGRMTQVLTEFASEVTGLERESEFVARATPLMPNIRFVQCDDLARVPLKDDCMDFVLTFTFVQHLIDRQAMAVLQELKRCLRKPGFVLLCENTDENQVVGDIDDPAGNCTIGRAVETYESWAAPLKLVYTQPRRIEPGYPHPKVGTYMLFQSDDLDRR